MLERLGNRCPKLRCTLDDMHAKRRPLARWFDDAFLADSLNNRLRVVVLTSQQRERLRSGKTRRTVHDLRLDLVHGKRTRQDAGSRVGHFHQLEKALHAAILAVFTVQRQKHHIGLGIEDLLQHVGVCRVYFDNGKTFASQRLCTGSPRCQRYLTLAALSSLQEGHPGLLGNARLCRDHHQQPLGFSIICAIKRT